MKKALQVASVASMIDQFNMENIKILQQLEYEVDVAANFEFGNTSSQSRVEVFKEELNYKGIKIYNLLFHRKIFNIVNLKVYKELKNIINTNDYEIIHCHSPIVAVLTRLASRKARKKGTKVIYTAHGFHFFKGAPLLNWLVYYPIEWVCSWITDVLITINEEDYEIAKKRMKSKKVYYVPGVGVDIEKFANIEVDRIKKRRELGVAEDAIVLLSVGELNKNKNHQVIIEAMALIENKNIHYCIVGKGSEKEELLKLASRYKMSDRVHFLGFREDVGEIYKSSDVFCFPSKREGLGLSAIEAMATGLPIITSNIHGINDYSQEGITGYKCNPIVVEEFKIAIENLVLDQNLRNKMRIYNMNFVKKFDKKIVQEKMKKIYSKMK